MGEARRRFLNRQRTGSPQVFKQELVSKPGKAGVLIAVPSGDGNIRWSLGNMFAQAQQLNARPDWPFTYGHMVLAGCSPTDYARNSIVNFFLEKTDCTWLYMVDADQEAPENWPFLTMVNGAQVVSGKTYCWVPTGYKEGQLRVNQYSLDQHARCFNITPPETGGNPYEVPIVGTGCFAVHREVFAKIPMPAFRFAYEPSGKIRAGEDINFSVACQRAGFKIAVHPSVLFGHVKAVNLANIDEYAEARHKFIAENRQHLPESMLSV